MYIIIFIILFIYFLPSIIALIARRSELSQIFIINLCLGWSVLFWVVSFRHAVGIDKLSGHDELKQK